MQLVRMETPDKDPTHCAIKIVFASGGWRVIHYHSDKPVADRPAVAREIMARVIEGLEERYHTADGYKDRREFNPASFLAALDSILSEFNLRLTGWVK